MRILLRTLTLFTLLGGQVSAAQTNWFPPTTLGNQNLGGTRETPRLVTDLSGNAAAAWIQSVDGADTDRAVLVSYYPAGGEWEPAVALESGIKSGNDVNLCIDDGGNITVVWSIGTTPSQLHSVFRPFGASSWGGIQTVADPGAAIDTYDHISIACISTNTQVVVLWEETTSKTILSNFRSGSSSWLFAPNAPQALPNSSQAQTQSIVKMQPNGTAQAVYMVTGIPGAIKLFYSEATTPGSWSTEQDLLIDNTMNQFDFDANNHGDAIVVARNPSSTSQTLTRVNGTWGTPQTQTGITNPLEFFVRLDDHGLATGIWQESGSLTSFTYNSFNIANPVTTTTWIPVGTTPSTITSSFTIENPRLAVSPNGNLLIAWREDSGTDPIFARLGASGTLDTKVTQIDTEAQPIAVAISNSGRGFALWSDLTGLKLPEVSQTYDPKENLLRALKKTRLITQKTRYP